MSDIGERIAAWEAVGLIDAETADRLRAAEAVPAAAGVPPELLPAARPIEGAGPSVAAAWFGPGVTIPEVFGYLGASFLLAGWSAFVVRIAGDRAIVVGAGSLLAALVLAALGVWLVTGDARRSRAAGVAFVAAVGYVGGGVAILADFAGIEWPLVAVFATVAAGTAALVLRVLHPSVLTQFGLLGALTSLAGALLAWAESLVVPVRSFDDNGILVRNGPDPVLLAVAAAAWWLVVAVLIGLIGLLESRAGEAGDPAAERRASLSRFWAGLVAVAGLASAITRSDYDLNDEFQRAIPAWIGDLALVVLSAVLVERAFRRDTTAYVYPAALGLILALSDVNVTYLSSSTEVALLVEGFILLGVGLAADRLRRRIGGPVPPDQGSTGSPAGSIDQPAKDPPVPSPTHDETAAAPPAAGPPGGPTGG